MKVSIGGRGKGEKFGPNFPIFPFAPIFTHFWLSSLPLLVSFSFFNSPPPLLGFSFFSWSSFHVFCEEVLSQPYFYWLTFAKTRNRNIKEEKMATSFRTSLNGLNPKFKNLLPN
jgi:hypothetical protein